MQCDFLVSRLEDVGVPSLGVRDVLVKMLAAPINPSDINMIQGIATENRLTNRAKKLTTVSFSVTFEDEVFI